MESLSLEEQVKKLKELDKYKDKLLATVSHDLRTPLIGINYNFDQIQYGQSQEELEKYKRQGKANSDLLMSFIHDILDYCQMKEEKIKLNLSEFNLLELCQEVAELLSIPAGLKGVKIELLSLIHNQEDQQIYSDPRRIKQILINLISNSLKFTQKGGRVQLIITLLNDSKFKFEVIDNGAGIKKEIIPKLAQPYATFDNEGSMNKQGIGLGLNICKKLIELMGPSNELFISSQLGKGSKFGFQIFKNCPETQPIQKKIIIKKQSYNSKQQILSENNIEFAKTLEQNDLLEYQNENSVFSQFNTEEISLAEQQKDEQFIHSIKKENYSQAQFQYVESIGVSLQSVEQEPQNYNKQKINILLADDNPFNILVLEKYCEKIQNVQLGILSASNGQEAFDQFKNFNKVSHLQNISIIIMDCEMPILNGFQASRMIKNLITKENYIECKIVGYTCYEGDEKKCKVHGMDLFLQKPAQEKTFIQFMENIVLKN